ncbi:hypothetical protein L247_22480, partial [Salmonella enterica subsp. enterica serovar Worthington str. BCH-7253]
RGEHACPRAAEYRSRRFIPAGAGNTLLIGLTPRICDGLSPLARGTLILNLDLIVQIRFIPAGAGNTPSAPVVSKLLSVY